MDSTRFRRYLTPALCITSILLMVLSGCTGLKIPGAMSVEVSREEGYSRSMGAAPSTETGERAPGDTEERISPDGARIAFTRIWYPTIDTARAILEDTDNTRMGDFTDIADPDGISSGCLTVLDCDADDPWEFDLADSGTTFSSDIMPVANTMYPGVIIETLYYEFDINDFTIRWYTTGNSEYQRKDVLIKTDASVSGGTGGVFMFAYVSNDTGEVTFFSERQTTSPTSGGYSCLVRDDKWSDWGTADSSGLLPGGTHLVLHEEIGSVNIFNSLFFMSGNAPEIIEYMIRYNLSVEYGGVEYSSVTDLNGDGDITFTDLTEAAGSRAEFDLTPITGAVEYSY